MSHGIIYFSCGKHIMVQCRCPDHGGNKRTSGVDCPTCQAAIPFEGSGKDRRDASLNQVEREPFKRLIAHFIDQLVPGEYSSETIRNAAQANGIRPHHHNAWGASIMAAIKRGSLVPTSDYRASHAPAKHARRIRIYTKP